MLGPDHRGGPQSFVAVPGRHPYVGDHDIRRFFADNGQQRVRVPDAVPYLVPGAIQDAGQSLA